MTSRVLTLLCVLFLVAAACSGDDDDTSAEGPAVPDTLTRPDDCIQTFAPAQDDEGDMEMEDGDMDDMDMDDMEMEDGEMEDGEVEDGDGGEMMMDDGEMMSMNMGDRCATVAADVGGDLVSGNFELLDTRPVGYDEVGGLAQMARHDNGTTVTIGLSGLIPNTDYISHVHVDGCDALGGDHFQFEIGGSVMPPNEIHLAFTSDADGNGFMTAQNDQTVDATATAVVVHPADLLDNKLACAEFS